VNVIVDSGTLRTLIDAAQSAEEDAADWLDKARNSKWTLEVNLAIREGSKIKAARKSAEIAMGYATPTTTAQVVESVEADIEAAHLRAKACGERIHAALERTLAKEGCGVELHSD
jgi:hypothetical protein